MTANGPLSTRRRLAGGLLLLGCTFWPGAGLGQLTPTAAGNAWQLLAASRAALADLEGRLAQPRSPEARAVAPLRDAAARFAAQLASVESRLRARDPGAFADLETGSQLLGELRTFWSQSGSRRSEIEADVRTLSASYRRLRSVYGREGLRFQQGGPLSAPERQQLEQLRQTTLIFTARLQTLRQHAVQQGDRRRVAEIDRYLAESDRIAQSEPDLSSYLNTVMADDEMAGEWKAQGEDLRQLDPQGWGDADEAVGQLYVESDIGHVFSLDLGKTPDGWAFLDEPPADDPTAADDRPGRPRMKVLQPLQGADLVDEEALAATDEASAAPLDGSEAVSKAPSATPAGEAVVAEEPPIGDKPPIAGEPAATDRPAATEDPARVALIAFLSLLRALPGFAPALP
jgi:hypothetical protein